MTKLRIFLLSVVVAAIAVGVWAYARPDGDVVVDNIWRPTPKTDSREIAEETSPEYTRRFFRDADGNVTEVHITYRSGEFEKIVLRKDKTLASVSLFFADGRLRRAVNYAADGKSVVSGEEIRADGSVVWRASSSGDLTTIEVFWASGGPYATRVRNNATGDASYRVFRESGALWMERVTKGADLVSLSSFDDAGKLAVKAEKVGDDLKVTYTRADGTLEFRQTWRMVTPYSGYGYDDYGYGYGYPGYEEAPAPTPVLTLKEVEVYGRTGKNLERKFTTSWNGGYFDQVEVYVPSGMIRKQLGTDGSVNRLETFDKRGKATGSQYGWNGQLGKEEVNERWKSSLPTMDEPLKAWKAREEAKGS